jgi:hypothetical protein
MYDVCKLNLIFLQLHKGHVHFAQVPYVNKTVNRIKIYIYEGNLRLYKFSASKWLPTVS